MNSLFGCEPTGGTLRSGPVFADGIGARCHSHSEPGHFAEYTEIFGTGEGLTTPPGITGEIAALIAKKAVLTATVQIGGVEAKVISATAAPNAIAGLFQINVQIPTTVQPGSASSQAAATVSVR